MGIRRPLHLLLVGGLALLSPPAAAHEQDERRDVVLIVAPGQLQLMVGYTLPAGAAAAEARALIDADASGRVDQPSEEVARATLLMPRLGAGLRVAVDGRPIELELADLAWRDGPGDPGPRQGFTGLALFTAPLDFELGATFGLELSVDEAAIATGAEVQLDSGVAWVGSAVPLNPDTFLLGPIALSPGLPLRLDVRIEGGPVP